MGKIVFWYDDKKIKELFESCAKHLEQRGHSVCVERYTERSVNEVHQRQDYDLLVISDLLGFDVRTLTNGVSLNMVFGKVYNLMRTKECKNENALGTEISISHFYRCIDWKIEKRLKEMYPHLPNVERIVGWEQSNEKNGVVLCDSICDVLTKCHID